MFSVNNKLNPFCELEKKKNNNNYLFHFQQVMRNSFPGAFPPNYPGHPRAPYVRDQRYRGNGPSPSGNSEEDIVVPPPIIKKEALEGFEDDPCVTEGWATSAAEVDYK